MNRSLRIAIDFRANLGYSGISIYTLELTHALLNASETQTFYLVTAFKKAKVLKRFFREDPRIHIQASFPHLLTLGAAFKNLVLSVHHILWRLKANTYDLVHFTDPNLYDLNVSHGAVTFHDLIQLYDEDYDHIRENLQLNDHYRKVTRHARVIFVPTAFVKQELVRWFECDEQKILVTGEGAKESFKPLKAIPDKLDGYGIGKNDRFFLYVGRLDKRKNIPRLLESFKNLCSQTSASLKLVMVSGGSQKRIEELESEISTKGLAGDVIHLQNLNDVDLAILYNAALALVLVSLSEGFGLPVVEAMQCGTPVITSNTTSLAEVAGDAAITVNPEDTEEIGHAMKQLLEDTALRQSLRDKGFRQAKEYSWEKTARLTLSGYEKALSNA